MGSKKIFIVEDVALDRMMLEIELKKNRFMVSGTAINAEEALQEIMRVLPDLMLLNIHLIGERNGLWLGKELNKLEKQIPFIYITAYQDNYTSEEILETNPVGFIPKPMSTIQLIIAIHVALKIPNEKTKTIIKLNDGKKILNIPLDEITHLQSEGNYVSVFTENHHFLIRNTLNKVMDCFPEGKLIRIHLRTAINSEKSYQLHKNEIVLEDKRLSISNTYRDNVLKYIQ